MGIKKITGKKGAKLKATGEGGYIVCYDQIATNDDAYDGYSYMGEKMEVFNDGEKALARLDEIVAEDGYMPGNDVDIKIDES